jgi:hypothetical protein
VLWLLFVGFLDASDLRDPFACRPPRKGKDPFASKISSELRDPFARSIATRASKNDLRDPFESIDPEDRMKMSELRVPPELR